MLYEDYEEIPGLDYIEEFNDVVASYLKKAGAEYPSSHAGDLGYWIFEPSDKNGYEWMLFVQFDTSDAETDREYSDGQIGYEEWEAGWMYDYDKLDKLLCDVGMTANNQDCKASQDFFNDNYDGNLICGKAVTQRHDVEGGTHTVTFYLNYMERE